MTLPNLIRVDLLLKHRSVCSEKVVKEAIRRGKVMDDHGNVMSSVTNKISPFSKVYVNEILVPPKPLLVMYHKPVGVLSTVGDTYGRPNLLDVVAGNEDLKGLHPVGRLDSDTSGLLLFSSCGTLTNILLQPSSNIQRTYEAVVAGIVDYVQLKSRLRQGVLTTDGVFPAKLLSCTHIKYDSSYENAFKSKKQFLITLGSYLENVDLTSPILSRICLSVTEGKHRMVRRILHNAGHSVVQLKRLSFGQVALKDLEIGKSCQTCTQTQLWAWNLLNKHRRRNHVQKK